MRLLLKQSTTLLLLSVLLTSCAKTKPSPQGDGDESDGPDSRGSVRLAKTVYRPGEQLDVLVELNGPDKKAWVGIVPSEIEHGSEMVNDMNDLGTLFIAYDKRTLAAPQEPGSYDLRLNDKDFNGSEIDFVTFEVKGEPFSKTEITLEKTEYYPGEKIHFSFTAAATNLRTDAWIGIVPSGIPHGHEELNDRHTYSRTHLAGRNQGSDSARVPRFLGKYDLRLNQSNSPSEELTYVTFEVIQKPAPSSSPNH